MTFIYHSHKILDGEVCAVMSAQQNLIFRYVDLARERLSYGLLLDLTGKMPHWQSELVDPKFLDHSIKDAEREFMILNTPLKLIFFTIINGELERPS
ncbi:MAG TPA: hypothetical protein VFW11_24310 [Cyclobacteriaceae bacterium]|nr:hypothetical protein [Cyclobacteriaceae bacterium]